MSVIAVIFDFDDTLLPDSTSALLQAHGIDDVQFWSVHVKQLVDQGYDPPLAYLNLLLEEVGADKPLGELTNAKLTEFGATLDSTWFEGLPDMFVDLQTLAAEHRDVSVEFYIISSGLEAVIAGSEFVEKHFDGFYGCQLAEDDGTGVVRRIKRCVTFTEKTRFLFEINKGIRPEEGKTQPHLVNRNVPDDKRRVPMSRMIYVGDGLTDIPCFSLIGKNGGVPLGVYKRGVESAKQAFQQFLTTDRVMSLHSPDYREDAELGAVIRAAVSTIASRINLESERPF